VGKNARQLVFVLRHRNQLAGNIHSATGNAECIRFGKIDQIKTEVQVCRRQVLH
jgi:hypothetical protein